MVSTATIIDYDEYYEYSPETELSENEFEVLARAVGKVVDAMLFHAISLGRVTEDDYPDEWEVIKKACLLEAEYAENMGLDRFYSSDGRQVASESGSIGGVSDSVTYVNEPSPSMGLYGGHPASREAYSLLASSGLVARLRFVRR